MGLWRSLREWWRWDGSPDTDPFRHPAMTSDDEVSGDVHAHAAPEPETEPLQGDEETGD